MIAVSSPRPHALSDVYARNQIGANASWQSVFDTVYYFGEPEEHLSGNIVQWIPINGRFPLMRDMMGLAGDQRQMVAILNADIEVTTKLLTVECQMDQKQIQAATSKRWQYDGALSERQVIDKGLDIFIARPWLWRQLAKECPAGYRIGHCEWDTWCLGMLMRYTHRKMADFTESKCVLHPVHGGRDMPLNGEVPKMPEWLYDYAKMPTRKIRA